MSGDGYVQFTASETTTDRIIGLSTGDTNQNYTDVDFGFYLGPSGYLCIYEAGVPRGCPSFYAIGATLKVAVEAGVVKYRQNGNLVYTSSVAPTYPLLVDTALYQNGSTITNAVISGNLSTGGSVLHWLVSDQLGTPRMILDQSGSLATMKRHDYLPFGEELFAGTGGRTVAQGYSGGDGVRQQFTSKERDYETGLDYFNARYYLSTEGRFTSVDPVFTSLERLIDPQRLNLYAYSRNSPLKFVDPTGADLAISAESEEEARQRFESWKRGLRKEDRSHTQFFVGDGKNGYEKGKFYIKVDADYKSESSNFSAVQSIANDRSGTALMFFDATGTKIADEIGVQEGKKVVVRDASEVLGDYVRTVMGPESENTVPGYTLYPAPKNPTVGEAYGPGKYIEVHIWKDQPEIEIVATQFHELRTHVFLSKMGRDRPSGGHPKVNADATAAEVEAKQNFLKN